MRRFPPLYLARPHVRHSEWAEEDHLKSVARFCWWADTPPRRLASERSEGGARVERGWSEGGARVERGWSEGGARVERGWSEGGGNNATRPLRARLSHDHRHRGRAGAGSLRAVCGSASSPPPLGASGASSRNLSQAAKGPLTARVRYISSSWLPPPLPEPAP